MPSLNDKKFSSLVEQQATAADNEIGTPAAQLVAGQYNLAGITLTDGQFGFLQFDSAGALITSGGGGSSTFNSITPLEPTHRSPQDFSATFTSSTTITTSGASFVIDDANCMVSYVYYKPSGGNWTPLINGLGGISLSASSDVITVAGGGTPFAAGDSYFVGVVYQDKEGADHLRAETLADVTDGADGTYYYYVDMETFEKAGFQYVLSGGSGTVTVTIEGSVQDDGTAQASVAYEDITNDTFSVTSATANDIWIDDAGKLALYKFVRIKVVASTGGANDADWTVYHRRIA